MSYLYLSCPRQESEGMIEYLHSSGQKAEFAGIANNLGIVLVVDPTARILESVARLIARKRLNSAALVSSKLSPDKLFVAAEWWNKFVCEKSEKELATAIGLRPLLRPAGENKPLGVVIFEIAGDVTSEHDDDDFVDIAPVSEELVLSNPEKYYEHFALDDVGGANALFAAGQEAALMRHLPAGTILVGRPEALGFEVDQNPDSVIAWRQRKAISVGAFGFSLSHADDAMSKWTELAQVSFQNCINADQTAKWKAEGIAFGLAILLRGVIDPPIVIPVGSVYQQPQMGSQSQNLALAKGGTYLVGAGATVPLVLPAWCINQTFRPPQSQMAPTPLIVPQASGSQRDVWDLIGRRYMSAR